MVCAQSFSMFGGRASRLGAFFRFSCFSCLRIDCSETGVKWNDFNVPGRM